MHNTRIHPFFLATEARKIETIGVRNVVREDPLSHRVAVIFAVEVDPATVTIGGPHKFDQPGWFPLDNLPSPLHSQSKHRLAIFQAWHGRR